MAQQVRSLADVFSSWCPNIPIDVGKEKFEKDEKLSSSFNDYKQYSEWVDNWWKGVEDKYGFRLRVVVSKDIPPRHETFSWIRGLGVSKFDEIFEGTVRLPSSWLLAFPERHTSIEERRSLIYQLCKLNKDQGYPMKQLDIITSEPFIISDTMNQCISMISFPEGKKTYAQDYMM